MKQTPAHEIHNPDLLRMIPVTSQNIIEIGCSTGALAREFKKINVSCHYFGIDIDSEYAEAALRYCDNALGMNIEQVDDSFWIENTDRDCWVFGDTLEHLSNPWKILRHIRSVIPKHGSVVACIPNAQHWSLQVKLSIGEFRYRDSGLLDRTHLRWFTRVTLIELFADSGFKVERIQPRIFADQGKEKFLPIIYEMAKTAGMDPDMAVTDALPLQYVIRATPC